MKINALSTIRNGIIGTTLALSAVSCSHEPRNYVEEAKQEAVKYLSGAEYLEAMDSIHNMPFSDHYTVPNMYYWDSINMASKIEQAFMDGNKMVLDSAAGKEYHKPEYKMPLNITNNDKKYNYSTIRNDILHDLAQNRSAEDIVNLIKNEPAEEFLNHDAIDGFLQLHYWNELLSVGRQREAFEQGAANARETLKDSNNQ